MQLRAPLAVLALTACATHRSEPIGHLAAPAPENVGEDAADLTAIRVRVERAGLPLVGATVAAVGAGGNLDEPGSRAAARATTDASGEVTLTRLSTGTYALTVTAPARVAAHRMGIVIDGRRAPARQTIALDDDAGWTLSGLVVGTEEEPLADVEVRAVRLGELVGDIFFTRTDAAGRYQIRLPPATYALLAAAPGLEADVVRATLDHDQARDLRLFPSFPGPAPAAVVAWARGAALPLDTVEAGHGFADLAAFGRAIGDARIVSLGEATHGTREIFQLKHRLLEYLVSERGFDVFAIEASMPESFAVNDYVLTGRGDPRALLTGLHFWTWDTEEILSMIEWMRAWNADPRHPRKVKFYGFDMQMPALAARHVTNYLGRADRNYRAPAELETIADPCADPAATATTAAARAALHDAVAPLEAQLDADRARLTQTTGAAAWALARQHARVLGQWSAQSLGGAGGAERDRAMAENVRWIAEHEGPASKLVLWAHDGHAGRLTWGDDVVSMGSWLHGAFGAQQVAVSLTFLRGGFRSQELLDGDVGGVRDFTIATPLPGSLAQVLDDAGIARGVLDLRPTPADPLVARWLDAGHPQRGVGSWYAPAYDPDAAVSYRAREAFDLLASVADTTAARGNPPSARATVPTLPLPTNLDFAQGLAGWYVPAQLAGLGFTAMARAYAGHPHAATLRRASSIAYCANVSQRIDGGAYRGARVRLVAYVRGDAGTRLWLHVGLRELQGVMPARTRVSTSANRAAWSPATLTLDVPADARWIQYGMASSGGEIAIDDLRVERVD